MSQEGIFWLLGTAAFLVGLSKGGLPAIGMLAVPVTSLVMSPVKAATMLLPIYVLSDVVAVWLYRKDFSAPNLRVLIPAGVLGVLLGWLLASVVSDRAVTLLIGGIGLAFCLNAWLRRNAFDEPRMPSALKGWFWGSLAGFTSFISHAGAPPFQMYVLPQKLPKAVFAGTATIVFAVINVAKILPYQLLRPYSTDVMWAAAGLVPFALVGTVAGAFLTRRLSDRWFFLFVQVSLFLVSLKLIASAIAP
jgi:uncharacterized protein